MRVALIVDDFPSTSQPFIVDKVVGLLARGVDVHVVCHGIDVRAWADYPQLRARRDMFRRVHAWPGRNLRGTVVVAGGLARAAARPQTLARYVKGRPGDRRGWAKGLGVDTRVLGLRPDLVHFEFGWLARAHGHLADAVAVPMTTSFRGADLNYLGLGDDDYYHDLWPRLSAIHCLGDDLWERAQQRGCPPTMPHARIPPAVDSDFFHPTTKRHREQADGLQILTVARLHWKKGIEYGLDAVRRLRLRGQDVRYRIVGDGPHESAVRACVSDFALDGCVELLGARSRLQVREQLASADVLLHPAISEGFANAVLEAQAMELPVVTTDADGLRANVEDGVTGCIVPRRDAGALAEALATVASDPALGRRLGQAGRQRVRAYFRPADQIDAWLSFYRSVIDARGTTSNLR